MYAYFLQPTFLTQMAEKRTSLSNSLELLLMHRLRTFSLVA